MDERVEKMVDQFVEYPEILHYNKWADLRRRQSALLHVISYRCDLFYGRRRREHELRTPEIIFFLCGAAVEVELFVMILSWLRIAEALEREAGIANVTTVRRYKGYLCMMALIILITLIIVHSVNTGLSGAIGIAFAASSVITLVHIVRKIRKRFCHKQCGQEHSSGSCSSYPLKDVEQWDAYSSRLAYICIQLCARGTAKVHRRRMRYRPSSSLPMEWSSIPCLRP